MARDSLPAVEDLLRSPPWIWLLVLSLGFPWLRLEGLGPVLYPGHMAGALVAGLLFATQSHSGHGWRGLRPLLLFSVYAAALLALRGAFGPALILLGSVSLHMLWGLAAYELARQGSRSGNTVHEGLLILIAATLAVGLGAWLGAWLWPSGCVVLPCRAGTPFPQPFLGGWMTRDQFVIWLIFALPFLGAVLLGVFHAPHAFRPKLAMSLLGAGCGLGLLAGAPLWGLFLAALAALLLWLRLAPLRHAGERLLARGIGFGAVFAAVLVYGLAPGYLGQIRGGVGTDERLRIEAVEDWPRVLSSAQTVELPLRLINAGWSDLGGGGGDALRVGARLVLTTGHGTARNLELPPAGLPQPIAPGQAEEVRVPVRLPSWVREGYLSWWAEDGAGQTLHFAPESSPGFRFINGDFRRLELDQENRLTALAVRARAFAGQTAEQGRHAPDPDSFVMMLGDFLDTLFFSPLWGEPGETGDAWAPFNTRRPFWADLFHRFGLIGLALALWAYLRIFRQSLRIAVKIPFRQDPVWGLLPLSLLLLGLSGLFSGDVAGYHAVWAFFLLSAWVDGRYATMFPRPVAQKTGRAGRSIRMPLFWRKDSRQRVSTRRPRRR